MDPFSAFIPIDRRHALAAGHSLTNRASGAVLFADISGFTPLTQALAEELGRQRGPEELVAILNRVYNALVDEIHRFHGSVAGFAGDAITCWFDGDDGWRAATAGLALQAAMQPLAQVTTPLGSTHTLAIKVAVAAGSVRRFVVGDPSIQRIDTIAGATLDRMAGGEHIAHAGEVLVERPIVERRPDRFRVSEWRAGPADGESFGVVLELAEPAPPSPWPPSPPLDEDVVRSWLLPPVYRQLQSRQEDLWAELRPAVPVFIAFRGIDYDGDQAAEAKLDAYIRWVQSVLAEVEGYLLQLTFGDKGSYLYAAFGAPISHDDDPARAVAAALRLRHLPEELGYITDVRIGITTGQVRAGAYGADAALTFGVQGHETNLAARLMAKAEPGQILVSQRVAERAGQRFAFRSLGAVEIRGSPEPLQLAEVVGEQTGAGGLFDKPLVGRENVLARLNSLLDQARAGRGRVVRLHGPAGVGKSHLVADLVREARTEGWRVAAGSGQSTAQAIPYFPWRELFRQLLDLPAGASQDATAAVTAALRLRLEALNPDWLVRLPLLGDLLGRPIQDNAITASFDSHLRREALFSLVVDLVQALSERQPLLLVLDDVHWMDESSLELSAAVARSIEQSRAVLLVVHRPPLQADQSMPLPEASQLANYTPVDLDELGPDGVAALAAGRLGGPTAPLVLALLQAKAQGNPFFVNELLDALREAGQIQRTNQGEWDLSPSVMAALRDASYLRLADGKWSLSENTRIELAVLGIPDTIQGVVLSRIDRLPEDQRLTLKVASVIGRIFELDPLHATHPAQPTRPSLFEHIDHMDRRDLVKPERPEPELAYIFRHNITQEVAYETLLFAQRRLLHAAVAEWIEGRYESPPLDELTLESPLAHHYPVLAYHWRHAENPGRERVYAGLAGAQAARQYANGDAVAYFSRALQLTADQDARARFDLLLQREEVFDRLGNRQAQAEDLTLLAALADHLDDPEERIEVSLRRANLARMTGDYDRALADLDQAEAWAEAAGNLNLAARCFALRGRILLQRDAYEPAEAWLAQAARLAEQADNPQLTALSVYDLANALYFRSQFDLARGHLQRALAVYRQTSNRRGEANCLRMLGVVERNQAQRFEAARGYYEQALAICREIGWLHGQSYLLDSIGNMLFDLGDYLPAQDYHQQALAICRQVGDREGESVSLDTLGLEAALLGENAAALAYYVQALDMARGIGYRRGEAFTLTHLAYALAEQLDAATDTRAGLAEAEDAFRQALAIRGEISPDSPLLMDDLAGLSRVALLRGDAPAALGYAEQVLAWIDAHRQDGDGLGTEGMELPELALLICYQALCSAGDGRADGVLQRARDQVMEAAGRIDDETQRRLFLEQVPWNRDLMAGLAYPG